MNLDIDVSKRKEINQPRTLILTLKSGLVSFSALSFADFSNCVREKLTDELTFNVLN